MTTQSDLVISAVCCLQTSIRGAFLQGNNLDEDGSPIIPPPTDIFLTDQPETPFCLAHSFGYVRYLGSGQLTAFGKPSDCFTAYEEKFEVVVGVCAPPPAAVLAKRGISCTTEQIYGECLPCGTDIKIGYYPPSGGECVQPVITEDGEFDWPQDITPQWTKTQFTAFLLKQRAVLRHNFLKVFCQCFNACKPGKAKADFRIDSVEPWCDGHFQGTLMVLDGSIE